MVWTASSGWSSLSSQRPAHPWLRCCSSLQTCRGTSPCVHLQQRPRIGPRPPRQLPTHTYHRTACPRLDHHMSPSTMSSQRYTPSFARHSPTTSTTTSRSITRSGSLVLTPAASDASTNARGRPSGLRVSSGSTWFSPRTRRSSMGWVPRSGVGPSGCSTSVHNSSLSLSTLPPRPISHPLSTAYPLSIPIRNPFARLFATTILRCTPEHI
jgi:hypothetical protein